MSDEDLPGSTDLRTCGHVQATVRHLEERCGELKAAVAAQEARASSLSQDATRGGQAIDRLTVRHTPACSLQLHCDCIWGSFSHCNYHNARLMAALEDDF